MELSKDGLGELNVMHYSLSTGGHILYIYSDEDKYLTNAVNYIKEGIANQEGVIFVDSQERIESIIKVLKDEAIDEETLNEQVTFVKATQFYQKHFPLSQSLHGFSELTKQYFDKNMQLRIWGDVHVRNLSEILPYECECDKYLRNMRAFTVCAYDGNILPSTMLVEMMAVHEYFMTDDLLVPSNLYNKPSSIPSISNQISLENKENNKMMRSEQLTFAGQFAAGICHEIRNPLTTIKGFFQLLKEDNCSEKYYEIIDQELERIQQITSELLLLAKPHVENRSKLNLINLVEEVSILLDSQAVMKSISINNVFKENQLMIDCDDTKIKQVIINIVKNAIEVMENGTITIELIKEDNNAILAIADEGPGIPRDILEKIGQPFFTTKKEGTGLGIIISLNIIKNHGGTMDIISKEGKGTTFKITLPLVE